MLNFELFVQGGDHSIVKVRTFVSDDPFGDTVSANKILFDEAGNHILSHGCEGSCFDPLCEVINAADSIPVSSQGTSVSDLIVDSTPVFGQGMSA